MESDDAILEMMQNNENIQLNVARSAIQMLKGGREVVAHIPLSPERVDRLQGALVATTENLRTTTESEQSPKTSVADLHEQRQQQGLASSVRTPIDTEKKRSF